MKIPRKSGDPVSTGQWWLLYVELPPGTKLRDRLRVARDLLLAPVQMLLLGRCEVPRGGLCRVRHG